MLTQSMGTARIPLELKLRVQRDYINGKGSVPELARLHKLSVHTIRTWAKGNHWQALREQRHTRKVKGMLSEPHDAEPDTATEQSPARTARGLAQRFTSLLALTVDWDEARKLMDLREQALRQAHFEETGAFPGTVKPPPARPQEERQPTREALPLVPAPDHPDSEPPAGEPGEP